MMCRIWRWWRSSEVAAAEVEARHAAEAHARAEQQRRESELEAIEAAAMSSSLRQQLERNGWTDLLRQAWGGAV